MAMKLAENILAFRKKRELTQEQLAEVLGVSVGAVYKWESGISQPGLDRLVEMADLFDTSVDVLLGYQMKDNRLRQTVQRLKDFRCQKDRAGLAEAEKALKKHPNSFEIVHESATIYYVFGVDYKNKDYYRRALELIERSLPLLAQNTDPEIGEQSLYGELADAYLGLGEWEKGVDLLKSHNTGGMFNDRIGKALAEHERQEEAVPFLSKALGRSIADLIHTSVGLLHVYQLRRDLASAQEILHWLIGLLQGLRKPDRPNFLDRTSCLLLGILAELQLQDGQAQAAGDSLTQAYSLAAAFDAAPSYEARDIRFCSDVEGASLHDDFGATAMVGLDGYVTEQKNEKLQALWEAIKKGEH